MTETVELDAPLGWSEIGAVAYGASLFLSENARSRINRARAIVEALVEKKIRSYGINTGVGALCDVIIDGPMQKILSRNIVMSHACGVGAPLGRAETRAIMAVMINTYAMGYSGVRKETVELLATMLNNDCIPVVRSGGSVGYLSHAAHIALVMIGGGKARFQGRELAGRDALHDIGREPLELEAKEGLSLVNGTSCSTGLASVALMRMERLMAWADAAAAMTYENLGNQSGTFAEETLSMRLSPGLSSVGADMRTYLAGSPLLAKMAGRRTQDPLSLRAVPQIHGAVRDTFDHVSDVLRRELSSMTDNPAVSGTPEDPRAHSQAHAVGAALALATDSLAIAAAELGAISERRIDRLVNPLVSGLPAFLTSHGGICTGFQVVHCTATSLVADNRRLALPASLDGGITAGLQEDMLTHATPSALKLLAILDNVENIVAIELLAAAQAYDLQPDNMEPGPGTDALRIRVRVRGLVDAYADDRPIADDIDKVTNMLRTTDPRSH